MTARVFEANGHTAECNRERDAYIQAKISYEEVYPKYCHHCDGWGIIVSVGDLVDYGATKVHLPSEPEPCSHCWEEGLCPRCGEPLPIESEEVTCPNCAWGYHFDEVKVLRPNDEQMGLPEPPECDCWYNQNIDIPKGTPVDWVEEFLRDTEGDDPT